MTTVTSLLTQIDWDQLLINLGKKALMSLIAYLIFLLLRQISQVIFTRMVNQKTFFTAQDIARQKTLLKLIRSLVNYSLAFILIYSLMALWGLPIRSLLAGAGIAGLAIGLGAQGFLTDLINGAFILIERQFDVGDKVTIQGITGGVTNLGIRTTQLKSTDGTLHFIPNRNITYVSNQSRGNRLLQLDLPLDFGADFAQVTQVLAQSQPTWLGQDQGLLELPKLRGPKRLKTGATIYRIEALVNHGTEEDLYYTLFQHYQDQLRQAGLAQAKSD